MKRRQVTPEQIAKAKERRAKTRALAKSLAGMSREDQAALVDHWPTTIEGHRVSLKNAMLIALQGGATVIGGLQQWRKAGRKVKKGGHSVQIFVPLGLRKQDPDGEPDGESPQGYGIANVFDISQTEDLNAAIAQDEAETGLESLTATQSLNPEYQTAVIETPYYLANKASIDAEMKATNLELEPF